MKTTQQQCYFFVIYTKNREANDSRHLIVVIQFENSTIILEMCVTNGIEFQPFVFDWNDSRLKMFYWLPTT